MIPSMELNSTSGIVQYINSGTTKVNCSIGNDEYAEINLTARAPITMNLTFTTQNPANISLPNALGYLSINCNNSAVVNFPLVLTFFYNITMVKALGLNESDLAVWLP